jgi:hypothetical protein
MIGAERPKWHWPENSLKRQQLVSDSEANQKFGCKNLRVPMSYRDRLVAYHLRLFFSFMCAYITLLPLSPIVGGRLLPSMVP